MVTSATGTMYPSTTCCIWADVACHPRRKSHPDVVLFSKQDRGGAGLGEQQEPTALSIA